MRDQKKYGYLPPRIDDVDPELAYLINWATFDPEALDAITPAPFFQPHEGGKDKLPTNYFWTLYDDVDLNEIEHDDYDDALVITDREEPGYTQDVIYGIFYWGHCCYDVLTMPWDGHFDHVVDHRRPIGPRGEIEGLPPLIPDVDLSLVTSALFDPARLERDASRPFFPEFEGDEAELPTNPIWSIYPEQSLSNIDPADQMDIGDVEERGFTDDVVRSDQYIIIRHAPEEKDGDQGEDAGEGAAEEAKEEEVEAGGDGVGGEPEEGGDAGEEGGDAGEEGGEEGGDAGEEGGDAGEEGGEADEGGEEAADEEE